MLYWLVCINCVEIITHLLPLIIPLLHPYYPLITPLLPLITPLLHPYYTLITPLLPLITPLSHPSWLVCINCVEIRFCDTLVVIFLSNHQLEVESYKANPNPTPLSHTPLIHTLLICIIIFLNNHHYQLSKNVGLKIKFLINWLITYKPL
jgi:hypothetical protein